MRKDDADGAFCTILGIVGQRLRTAVSRSKRQAAGVTQAISTGMRDERSPTRALAVLAPRPAAGPALAFLQLLLGPANAALSRPLLLRILDPTDKLVAGQGRDVAPGSECGGVRDQRRTQVFGELVHHPTGHVLAGHG